MAYGKRSVSTLEQDEFDATMRALGLKAENDNEDTLSAADVRARLDHGRAALDARVDRANGDMRAKGFGPMRPFFLIPDSCWNGPMGEFLMRRLGLFPFDEWNVALLPGDEKSALALDLPLHPNGNVPAFVNVSEQLIFGADRLLRHAELEGEDIGQVREEIRDRVRGTANIFFTRLDETWRGNRPGRA